MTITTEIVTIMRDAGLDTMKTVNSLIISRFCDEYIAHKAARSRLIELSKDMMRLAESYADDVACWRTSDFVPSVAWIDAKAKRMEEEKAKYEEAVRSLKKLIDIAVTLAEHEGADGTEVYRALRKVIFG